MAAPSAAKSKTVDMTTGPLWDKLIVYFLPVIISIVVQRLFSTMDIAVIGRFAGKSELAAVSCTGPFVSLLTNLVAGIATGSTIIIGQLIGAKDEETAKRAIHNSVFVGFMGGVIIAVLGVIFTRPILVMMATPDDIINLATSYVVIIFISKPFALAASFASSVARSKGDSKTPLLCNTLTSISKLVLNVILVAVFHLGVVGVAIATVIASIVNCISIFICLMKDDGPYKLLLSEIKPDKNILFKIAALGIPGAIQACLLPFTNMVVQSSYNSLGTVIIAASSASSTLCGLIQCAHDALGNAAIAFVSQNYGAKKLKRCKKTLFITIGLSTFITYTLDFFVLKFNNAALGIITTDPEVIKYATEAIFYTTVGHFFLIITDHLTCALRGFGKATLASLIYMLGIGVLRVAWTFTVFDHYKTFSSLVIAMPVTLAVTAIAMFVAFVVIYRKNLKKHSVDE